MREHVPADLDLDMYYGYVGHLRYEDPAVAQSQVLRVLACQMIPPAIESILKQACLPVYASL